MAKKSRRPMVYLGLSGGVDSSVAAALLLEQGYDVVPVFLKCWDPETLNVERPTFNVECPWQEDQDAAYAVSEKLGIARAFRSWNFSEEFFETVVRYLVDEAAAGRTGNPDVVCNRTIKFGAFLERANAEGADFVATGHYARAAFRAGARSDAKAHAKSREKAYLLRPRCEAKNDQTYFLWQLTQWQLARCLFPIGEFPSKETVRKEARRRGLPAADRKSTRGICFVNPQDGYAGFLKRFLPTASGDVVATTGRIVGRHSGLPFYTLGQRQGIGVTADGGPYYVVAKDGERNRLIVAPPADAQYLWQREVVVGNVSWISGKEPALPLHCEAFVRHPQDQPVRCLVTRIQTDIRGKTRISNTNIRVNSRMIRVQFSEAQYAPAPGQSVVFYDGDTCLGGGVIRDQRAVGP